MASILIGELRSHMRGKKKSKEMKVSHLKGSKGGMALLSGTRLVVLSPIPKTTSSPMFPIPLSGTTTHTKNLKIIIGLLPPPSHQSNQLDLFISQIHSSYSYFELSKWH